MSMYLVRLEIHGESSGVPIQARSVVVFYDDLGQLEVEINHALNGIVKAKGNKDAKIHGEIHETGSNSTGTGGKVEGDPAGGRGPNEDEPLHP